MEHVARLTLAALVHDLPVLAQEAGCAESPALRRVLDLAHLDDPALAALLHQAEGYAMRDGSGRALVTDRPLRSIFAHVTLRAEEPPPAYRTLAPLPATNTAQDPLFPTSTADTSQRGAYLAAMFDALTEIGARVDLSCFEHAYAHLLAWLQRWGWCVPAHSDDISLFDHARLTSAITACLAHVHAADLRTETVAVAEADQRFCLLAGDLSGIQDYIFAITSIGPGGVARRLRARSFYLAALAESLGHQIAVRFQMPLGNVIMAAGGKFYVLVPNQEAIDERVAQLRRDIDGWLHETFNGEIGINLAHVCFAGVSFQASSPAQPGFGTVMSTLARALNREKRRRGQGVLVGADGWNEDAFVFRKRSFWGAGACVSCGKFPAQGGENLCEQCEQDVQLGRQLPQARYVAYYTPEAAGGDIPLPLGWSARVLVTEDALAQVGEPYLVVKLNDPRINELADLPGTFRYLANYVPVGDYGAGLGFADIAAQAHGRSLLGYLKADVDNLGMLFAQGFRRDGSGYDTAAHIAALSRELDLFFSGWVQHRLSQSSDDRNFYTIFSGGDDLFLVGPWDRAADLARNLRAELGRFAGGNPDITLSAGILFTKERYPIARAGKDAERALEHAKEHPWYDADGQERTRDQISVLGDVFRWEVARDIFMQIAMLQKHAQSLTSALLYDLIEYGRLYRLWSEQSQVEGLRYKALFAYNIARNLRRGNVELYRWADELLQSLHGNRASLTMHHLGLIATYILFARRTN